MSPPKLVGHIKDFASKGVFGTL